MDPDGYNIAAFVILFMAPGNDVRVASEIATWMPGYKELSVGNHLFMTIQWMLSSFANEGKAFLLQSGQQVLFC